MQVAKGSPHPAKVKADQAGNSGEERGLCPGRHFQVQSSTSQVRKAAPTSEYAFFFFFSSSWLFPNHPTLLHLLILFHYYYFSPDQGYAKAAVSHGCCSRRFISQPRLSVCISAVRDCVHTPWQAPRMSPKPQLTSNHFHSRLLWPS